MKNAERPRKVLLRLKLALAAALSLLILGWLCWDAYYDYRDAEALLPTIGRLEIVRGQIAHLDAVLTMSARMAAASGTRTRIRAIAVSSRNWTSPSREKMPLDDSRNRTARFR